MIRKVEKINEKSVLTFINIQKKNIYVTISVQIVHLAHCDICVLNE